MTFQMNDGIPPRYEVFRAVYPELALCRVALQEKGMYWLLFPDGMQRSQVSGKFQYEAKAASDYPAVGDYVAADRNGGHTAVIHAVLPRKSAFFRKAAGTEGAGQIVAANVDTVFLCMALNHDFNLRRLERYLAMAWDSGASPVVLLTKADLCDDLTARLAQVERVAAGTEIVAVSALETGGCRSLDPYLIAGNTLAFVGSSGVGKSTLVNVLLGTEKIKTGTIRSGDDRGRHTTTHRELIVLSSGASVIDTPGMRELGMWDAGDGLSAAFADIESLSALCRFRDCTHKKEPGCAVRAAVERGELSEERLRSFEKLRTENAWSEDAEACLRAKGEKFKRIAKANRTNPRLRR